MQERRQNADRRKHTLLSPASFLGAISCLLAVAVVAGGFLLVNHQEAVLSAEHIQIAEERGLLIDELEKSRLNGPQLRLEELATLPLVSEFVDLSSRLPDSTETRELRDYLQTVLEAASIETGLERITILDDNGHELLVAGDLLSNAPALERHELSAVVRAIDDPEKVEGKLAGYIPKNGIPTLLPTDATSPSTTAGLSSSKPYLSNAQTTSVIPRTTRYLALIAGIAIAVSGLTGAFLLRRREPHST